MQFHPVLSGDMHGHAWLVVESDGEVCTLINESASADDLHDAWRATLIRLGVRKQRPLVAVPDDVPLEGFERRAASF